MKWSDGWAERMETGRRPRGRRKWNGWIVWRTTEEYSGPGYGIRHVSYRIVSYRIAVSYQLYCGIVLYCIVLYCIAVSHQLYCSIVSYRGTVLYRIVSLLHWTCLQDHAEKHLGEVGILYKLLLLLLLLRQCKYTHLIVPFSTFSKTSVKISWEYR